MSTVAILTNFLEFHPGYSLTGIVLDQVMMLQKFGHEVTVFTSEKFDESKFHVPNFVKVRSIIPQTDLIDFRSKYDLPLEFQNFCDNVKEVLVNELKSFDFVFTHDWVYTGWNLPFALAIQAATKELKPIKPHLKWFHWIHSIPTTKFNWWDLNDYDESHFIIFPNSVERDRVAEQFRTSFNRVKIIPHIKDLRSWFDFDKETCRFIDDFPSILQSEVVQVYPAAADRLIAKGVLDVLLLFSQIKARGLSVSLVIADQWATGRNRKQEYSDFEKIATSRGLKVGEDFIFTSRWDPVKYGSGIPKRMLRELWQCSNLFIYPTREESFGLVGPEASLSSCVLMVLNKSLTMQYEVNGLKGVYLNFGSFDQILNVPDKEFYLETATSLILNHLINDEAIMSRTFIRRQYNFENVYRKFYEPLLLGALDE